MSETGLDLAPLLMTLIVASCVALLAKRMKVPYTSALVLASVALAFVFKPLISLDRDVLFFVLLPPLIFEGGLGIDLNQMWNVRFYVVFFAVAGVVITAAAMGLGLQFAGVPLPVGLLIGAIVAATDPVGVITLFRDLGVPRRLRTIVEAESLLNDGTGVVLFGLVLAFQNAGSFQLLPALGSFALVTIGGLLVGAIFGGVAFLILRPIEDKLIETMLTLILAYVSYSAAEALHVSGIISTAAAGVIIGTYGKPLAMQPLTRVSLGNFWEIISFTVNSFLFVVLGSEVHGVVGATRFAGISALAIGIALAARAVMVYPFAWVLRKTSHRLDKGWSHILLWGGLRGAIPAALALSLPQDFPERDLILSVVFALVLFTLVVQGLSFPWLLRHLGLTEATENDQARRTHVLEAARAAAVHEGERVAHQQGLSKTATGEVLRDLEARLGHP